METRTGRSQYDAANNVHLAPPTSLSHGVRRVATIASDRQGSEYQILRLPKEEEDSHTHKVKEEEDTHTFGTRT